MSFSIDKFVSGLIVTFENVTVTYKELEYNGKIPVFFIRCRSLEELAATWTKLVDAVAFDFQSQLNDDFQIWNIYIFFIKPTSISNELTYNSLKLKIENDTFSSRKILVEDQDVDEIIKEHIINNNLNFSANKVSATSTKFNANPLLWSLLEDKVLKRQKITAEAGNAFEELVKQLKTN